MAPLKIHRVDIHYVQALRTSPLLPTERSRGIFTNGALHTPRTARHARANMEKQKRQERQEQSQHQHRPRYSMSDIPEDPNQRLASFMPSSRKRADSHQPRTPTPQDTRRSSDEQLSQQAVISAYLRSSYSDDDTGRPRRFSSAEHYYSPSPAHHNSHGEIRKISGNFNAPTVLELQRHKDYKRSWRGLGKLKNAVRGLVRA